MPHAVTPPPAPKKKRRFGCLSIFLTGLALLLLAVSVALWLAWSAPEQWKAVQRMLGSLTHEEKIRRASNLENMFANEAQGIRGPADVRVLPDVDVAKERDKLIEGTIIVPIEDVNIWLATKLPQWLDNQNASLPAGLSDPRVWVEDERLVLSTSAELNGMSGVVSVTLDARMREDGKLELKVANVYGGKLPLPPGAVEAALRQQLEKNGSHVARRVAEAFNGTVIDPVWDDPANKTLRQGRLIGFEIFPDRVELKVRNEPKAVSSE